MHVLVVGSSMIDLFVKTDSQSHTHITDGKVSFSLGDKIPIDIENLALGGNGANVSVGLRRLGTQTTFFTYLGADILSRKIEDTICDEDVTLIAERGESKNSSLSLIFNFDIDRVIFSHHVVREHGFEYKEKSLPDLIYLTSIGQHWKNAYKKVLEFARAHTIPLAFSPGSHQLDEIDELFFEVLGHSHYLFINKEEAEKISEKKGGKDAQVNSLLAFLSTLGPKVVSITDGNHGAYGQDTDGSRYYIEAFGNQVTEKTGAGDAYASGFLATYIKSQNIRDAMRAGVLNAASVMGHIGAQMGLLTEKAYGEFSKNHIELQAREL